MRLVKTLRRLHIIAPNQSFREHCWRNDAWMIDEYRLPELTNDEIERFKHT